MIMVYGKRFLLIVRWMQTKGTCTKNTMSFVRGFLPIGSQVDSQPTARRRDEMVTMDQEVDLSNLSKEDQIKELKQFFINMMDYTEQTESEEIYIKLHDTLKKI